MIESNIWLFPILVYLGGAFLVQQYMENMKDMGYAKPIIFYIIWATIMVLYTVGVWKTVKDDCFPQEKKENVLDLFYMSLLLTLLWCVVFYSTSISKGCRMVCSTFISLITIALYGMVLSITDHKGYIVPIIAWQSVGTLLTITGW